MPGACTALTLAGNGALLSVSPRTRGVGGRVQLRYRYRPVGPKPGLLLSHGEPAGGGEDLKGPKSGDWGLEGTRVSALQSGKAGRAETRGCAIGGGRFWRALVFALSIGWRAPRWAWLEVV